MSLPFLRPLALGALGVLAGCGMMNPYTPLNGGPPDRKPERMAVYDIDCRDTSRASGATTVQGTGQSMLNRGLAFYAACTYEGKPLPWKVLGVFHAGADSEDDWDSWRKGAIDWARSENCPGVGLRTFAPTYGDTNHEAVGALCLAAGGE